MREEVNCSCSVENVPKGPNQSPAISTLPSRQLFIVMTSVTFAEASNINDTIQRNLLNSHLGNSAAATPAKLQWPARSVHSSVSTPRSPLEESWGLFGYRNCPAFLIASVDLMFCDLNRWLKTGEMAEANEAPKVINLMWREIIVLVAQVSLTLIQPRGL